MRLSFAVLVCFVLLLNACDDNVSKTDDKNTPDKSLKVIIIRHAEKPADKPANNKDGNDNLSCQGQNRALQLPAVLIKKIGKPNYTYVPALKSDKYTAHSRMFQTVTPLAVKYNLVINSKYEADDLAGAAKSVLKKSGTVLMVWSHSEMANLASALGVKDAPKWKDDDFDSMWIVSYAGDKPELKLDAEGLNPQLNCSF